MAGASNGEQRLRAVELCQLHLVGRRRHRCQCCRRRLRRHRFTFTRRLHRSLHRLCDRLLQLLFRRQRLLRHQYNLNLLPTSSTTTIHTPPTATILLVTSSSAIRPAFELLRLQNPLRLPRSPLRIRTLILLERLHRLLSFSRLTLNASLMTFAAFLRDATHLDAPTCSLTQRLVDSADANGFKPPIRARHVRSIAKHLIEPRTTPRSVRERVPCRRIERQIADRDHHQRPPRLRHRPHPHARTRQ